MPPTMMNGVISAGIERQSEQRISTQVDFG
jgi:hypothetical protein